MLLVVPEVLETFAVLVRLAVQIVLLVLVVLELLLVLILVVLVILVLLCVTRREPASARNKKVQSLGGAAAWASFR